MQNFSAFVLLEYSNVRLVYKKYWVLVGKADIPRDACERLHATSTDVGRSINAGVQGWRSSDWNLGVQGTKALHMLSKMHKQFPRHSFIIPNNSKANDKTRLKHTCLNN